MPVVFFHQNEVAGAQGGIERYLSTLLDEAGDAALLVTEAYADTEPHPAEHRLYVSLPFRGKVPKWISYIIGVGLASRRIRRAIRQRGSCTLEFSRPEYALISWMFGGKKVFTIHGTGPARSERGKYWIHYASCLMLPAAADVVQIVGRDKSGLPGKIAQKMKPVIQYIDAWYDDVFQVTPFPAPQEPLRVFFAGRLAPMKNPELLFKVIEAADRRLNSRFEARYFGADADKIPDSLKSQFRSFGLLNVAQLARAIADCHFGILCSGFGEGSPFIVVEALASGRGFVLPPLPGLLEAYSDHVGVVFASEYTVDSFIEALGRMEKAVRAGLAPQAIAKSVSGRSKHDMAQSILRQLQSDHA